MIKKIKLETMSTVVRVLILLVLVHLSGALQSQERDSSAYQNDEVSGMVSLYKYMLNSVGASTTPLSEKETIINESYQKIFRDSEVQIEDDLQENRSVILNKSVESYLRDIDFFFKRVSFDFADLVIDTARNEKNELFYKVRMTVTLQALDLQDSSVSRTYNRFMEINETKEEGLKIVSIYSTTRTADEQLWDWWGSMDSLWQSVFIDSLVLDSITISDLQRFVLIDSLDLSDFDSIRDLTPITELRSLIHLDLAGTVFNDLLPLRYAGSLLSLDISDTEVYELSFLHYLKDLSFLNTNRCRNLDKTFLKLIPDIQRLELSGTTISDFSMVSSLRQLRFLDLSNTPLADGEIFSDLELLQYLNISNTSLKSLIIERELSNLVKLDVSNTLLKDISFMGKLPSLNQLNIEYTDISDLKSLSVHPVPLRVLGDFTKVKPQEVNAIMAVNKQLIVLTETDQIISWWNELPEVWRNALQARAGWKPMPTIEDLVLYLQVDSLSLSGERLYESKYLGRFRQLKYLNLSGTYISNLSFLSELSDVTDLDVSYSQVSNIKDLINSESLKYLNISGTKATSLGMLGSLPSLENLFADETEISPESLDEFSMRNPKILLVYRSNELKIWWDNLNPSLKRQLTPLLGKYSVGNLHRLVLRKSLDLKNFELRDFEDLEKFRFLTNLKISEMSETILPDLSYFHSLDSLSWQRSPVVSLESLRGLTGLKYLNIANTAVEDLSVVGQMKELVGLDCSGTQIKNLKELRELGNLKFLNISNTRVWQLNWLNDIRGIDALVCYNTRISDRQIEQFKDRFPQCVVTNY